MRKRPPKDGRSTPAPRFDGADCHQGAQYGARRVRSPKTELPSSKGVSKIVFQHAELQVHVPVSTVTAAALLDRSRTMDRALTYNFGFLPPNKANRKMDGILSEPLSMKRMRLGINTQQRGPNTGVTPNENTTDNSSLEWRCVNYIRVLAAEMVQQANSGHPGAAMGCAPIAHLLWSKVGRGSSSRHAQPHAPTPFATARPAAEPAPGPCAVYAACAASLPHT